MTGPVPLAEQVLSGEDATVRQGEVDRLALRLVCSAESQVASRLTAIQVGAERGLTEALPAIQSVRNADACVPLRLSALAALGRLGGDQQTDVLGQAGVEDKRVVPVGLRMALPQGEQNSAAF